MAASSVGRERRGLDPVADLRAGLGQRAHVVGVRASASRALMRVGQAVVRQELAEGVRRGREAAGHAHARGGQLADHFAEARRSCRRPTRRRSSSGVRTARPGRSPVQGWTWENSVMLKNRCFPPCRAARPERRSRAVRRTQARPHCSSVVWRRAAFKGVGGGSLAAILRASCPIIEAVPPNPKAAPPCPTAPCSSSPTAPASPPRPSATRSWRSSPAKPRHVRRPFIDSADKAHQVVREINHTAEAEGQRPIVFITLVNAEILAIVKAHCQGPGARHVQHLHRAARGRVRRQVEPPRRPLLRCRQEPGVHRPHRGDQLLAGARRRPVGARTSPRPT